MTISDGLTGAVRIDRLVLLAGAARSGTTAVAESLGRHPDVSLSFPKEPHFLALADEPSHFTGPNGRQFDRDRLRSEVDYQAAFDASAPVKVDASVSSSVYWDGAFKRAKDLSDKTQVVFVLRDPVERAWSNYRYMVTRGLETASFEEAIQDEHRRRREGWPHIWWYRELGFYEAPVGAAIEFFGPASVNVLLYDDLRADAETFLNGLQDWLGLAPSPGLTIQSSRNDSKSAPRSGALARVAERSGHFLPTRIRRSWAMETIRWAKTAALYSRSDQAPVPSDTDREVLADLSTEYRSTRRYVESLVGRQLDQLWRWDGSNNDAR